MIRQTIEWLGKQTLPVFVREIPNVFCIFSRSRIARHVVVTIISLNSDTFAFFPLDMAPEWTGSEMEVLEQYGL